MQLTNVQGLQIAPLMSFPHGNCKLPAREVLEGWLFVTKEGCSWRALAEPYGP
ncbi:MAG: transposase [Chloroflexi bacterium]|nr:transposase [Chloroflexota bacterium]